MNIPASLIEELISGRLVPFVGSGVSLSLKTGLFPTWTELLERLAQRLTDEAKAEEANAVRYFCKKGRLYDAAEEARNELGKIAFFRVLTETFKMAQPDAIDLSLPQAIWRLRPAIVVTTNYEDVLRWANPPAEIILNDQPAELAELYRTATPDKPRVWHVHGHISRADSLILAPAQYQAFYRDTPQTRSQYEAALAQLKNLLANYSLLFVGFGLNDEYVMDLLAGVLETFGGNLRSSYALVKQGEPKTGELWKRYNVRPLEYPDHGPPLLACFEEIRQRQAASAKAGSAGRRARAPIVPPTYTDWLRDQCGDIDLLGLRLRTGLAVTLNNVYVPLTAAAAEPAEEHGERRRPEPLPDREPQRPPLLLDLLDKESLYLSGPPGCGKSTFCRWVAWLACGDAMPAHELAPPEGFAERFPTAFRGRLPVLVRLRDFWTALPDGPDCQELTRDQFAGVLEAWVQAKKPGGLTWPLVQDHLENGSALLISDGVDEVPITHGPAQPPCRPRAMLLAGLSAALPGWTARGNRVLVTSRPYGLTAGEQRRLGLRQAPVSDLPEEMQRLLVGRWFHSGGQAG